MTNHEVWVGCAWSLYVFAILQGAYRASGINHAAMLNVTSSSHILILFLLGSALVDSTSQFPDFFSAFLTGILAFMVIGASLFLLRRKLEWNETLAALRTRAALSAGLAAQPGTPSQHRDIVESPQAAPAPANLPATRNSSN
jgi:hypothetical protein